MHMIPLLSFVKRGLGNDFKQSKRVSLRAALHSWRLGAPIKKRFISDQDGSEGGSMDCDIGHNPRTSRKISIPAALGLDEFSLALF